MSSEPPVPKLSGAAQADGSSLTEMLSMLDVATTLRRAREQAEAQLDHEQTVAELRRRLLATAEATGERVTEAEVDAAIERYFSTRFEFAEPPRSFKKFLAWVWVRRVLVITMGLLLAATLVLAWWLFFSPAAPLNREGRQQRALAAATARFDTVGRLLNSAARTEEAKQRAQNLIQRAATLELQEDREGLEDVAQEAERFLEFLEQDFDVLVANPTPGRKSAVIRAFDGAVSGHYLIVEAIGKSGKALSRSIRDAEQGDKIVTVTRWGEQVPKGVYERLGRDKREDSILDERLFARKQRGAIRLEIVMQDDTGSPLVRGRQITRLK